MIDGVWHSCPSGSASVRGSAMFWCEYLVECIQFDSTWCLKKLFQCFMIFVMTNCSLFTLSHERVWSSFWLITYLYSDLFTIHVPWCYECMWSNVRLVCSRALRSHHVLSFCMQEKFWSRFFPCVQVELCVRHVNITNKNISQLSNSFFWVCSSTKWLIPLLPHLLACKYDYAISENPILLVERNLGRFCMHNFRCSFIQWQVAMFQG